MYTTLDSIIKPPFQVHIPKRQWITIAGPHRVPFLQGLVSCDVTKVAPNQALWGAYLTPQGKFLYDFFLFTHNEKLYLEVDQDEIIAFGQNLYQHQLTQDITLGLETKGAVTGLLAPHIEKELFPRNNDKLGAFKAISQQSFVFKDPRHYDMGVRIITFNQTPLPSFLTTIPQATMQDYDLCRIKLGIPAGRQDLIAQKGLLLEAGFDELHGLDWDKGCYMGQELTARTRYRGLIKKRLLPITVSKAPPPPLNFDDTLIAQGKTIGTVRSTAYNNALAFVRLDRLLDALQEKALITIHNTPITVHIPHWIQFSEKFSALSQLSPLV